MHAPSSLLLSLLLSLPILRLPRRVDHRPRPALDPLLHLGALLRRRRLLRRRLLRAAGAELREPRRAAAVERVALVDPALVDADASSGKGGVHA